MEQTQKFGVGKFAYLFVRSQFNNWTWSRLTSRGLVDSILHHTSTCLRRSAGPPLCGTWGHIPLSVRHLLAYPFYQSFSYIPRIRCLVMDPTIRVVGAVSLWAIEIVMQLRVYALFNCSRKVGLSVSNALLATQTLIGRNLQRNTLHILCGRLCCTVGERFGRTS